VRPDFFIEPFVVREGVTLLWAKYSRGKSPLTWVMAQSIGSGKSFFGLPVKQGKVLYLDVDSPPMVLKQRVQKLTPAPNVWWLLSKPLGIPDVAPEEQEMLDEAQENIRPDVVFLNTLRQIHNLDDKESRTPKLVYTFFKKQFPQAALFFVHHERKTSTDPRARAVEGEDFSGSQHWIDDAQVGLQIEKWDGSDGRANLRLYHRKSQVSPMMKSLPLLLDRDGSNMSSPLFDEMMLAYDLFHAMPERGQALDRIIKEQLKCSDSTARDRRIAIEEGRFPGVGWLLKVGGDD
jgi:hypothetical protein